MKDRWTYSGFIDWYYGEVFTVKGSLRRLDFAIIIGITHFIIIGLSIVLPFAAPIFFFGGAYLMIINGYKRVSDINNGRDISTEWRFVIFICAFIPVVWQILALILIFSPRKDKINI